ncbi:ABC transporter permease [Thermodesulfobacteriota bacterium]
MMWFLLKGLLRDRQRSFFPLLIVAIGVFITIVAYCFLLGVGEDVARTNAILDTGHVKIMTRAYADIPGQLPNDLALFNLKGLLAELERTHPQMEWVPRTKFGGLLDLPDERGETRAQGPVFGLALDLLGPDSTERKRLNLERALVRGHLPRSAGEILLSETMARKLGARLGEMATLISATSNGSMAIHNFTVAGTMRFGAGAIDRNAMLADISDIQYALDMEDGAGEVLGYFPSLIYKEKAADAVKRTFAARVTKNDDEFTPVMLTLREQNNLGEMIDLMKSYIFIVMIGLVFVMSIVLWNTGLMSGLRRYGEVGVRLAMGESKGHVYRSLIHESMLIGIAASAVGTALGLAVSFYLQEKGLDVSHFLEGATVVWPNIYRARITPFAFCIGFIPGLLATILGTAISGIGIFRRQTSQLFKELET